MSSDQHERTLPLREANQAFARVIREVEGGAAFTITRNGAPVARIVPLERAPRKLTPEQEAARVRSEARMMQDWPAPTVSLTRDQLHER